ncbi:hypothetical protein WJX77_007440 [Trebouxia sp. C0004]
MEQVLDKYQAVEEAAVCMAICHPSVSDNKSPKVCSPQPRLDRILTVAQQIAAALEHVHSQSVVHGDVTSHNVLLANRVTRHMHKIAEPWALSRGSQG